MNIFKELRKQKRLTQVELAQKLHVEQTTISKWENNKSTPDMVSLKMVAKFFNVSIDTLMGSETYNPPELNKEDIFISENKKQLIEMVKELNEDDVLIATGIIARLNNKPVEDIFKKIN